VEFGAEMIAHVKFFVNVGNFKAPHNVMLSITGLLQSAYNEFGYRLKMDKGSYLLGKCESALVAETR
jgi:hypothetical protein